MLKEITKYIENNTTLVIGTNLFAGHRPSNSPNTCVLVLETAGGLNDFYLTDYIEKNIQILTRARNYFTARSQAYTIHSLLHGKAGITLPIVVIGNEYLVDIINAVHIPQPIGQDDKGRYEFSTNYVFKIQNA